jgi:hypothetical protein
MLKSDALYAFSIFVLWQIILSSSCFKNSFPQPRLGRENRSLQSQMYFLIRAHTSCIRIFLWFVSMLKTPKKFCLVIFLKVSSLSTNHESRPSTTGSVCLHWKKRCNGFSSSSCGLRVRAQKVQIREWFRTKWDRRAFVPIVLLCRLKRKVLVLLSRYDFPQRPLICRADSLPITISVLSANFNQLWGTVPDGLGPRALRICLLPCFTRHIKVWISHTVFS